MPLPLFLLPFAIGLPAAGIGFALKYRAPAHLTSRIFLLSATLSVCAWSGLVCALIIPLGLGLTLAVYLAFVASVILAATMTGADEEGPEGPGDDEDPDDPPSSGPETDWKGFEASFWNHVAREAGRERQREPELI